MKVALSAHDILRFRRRHADWEVNQVFIRGVEIFCIELIEEIPEDTVRWSVQRTDGRVILWKRGARANVPASLFGEVIAAHRAAIVTCLDQQLQEALIDLHGARVRARKIRAAIAATRG